MLLSDMSLELLPEPSYENVLMFGLSCLSLWLIIYRVSYELLNTCMRVFCRIRWK